MSYRYINSPDQALGTLLSGLSQRVSAIERRIRWPGATQFGENLDNQLWASDGEWHTICTIDLDPGRWMVYGSASLFSALVGSAMLEIQIRDGSSLPSGTSNIFSGTSSLTIISSLLLPRSGGAAVLQARCQTVAAVNHQAESAFIIAVPT